MWNIVFVSCMSVVLAVMIYHSLILYVQNTPQAALRPCLHMGTPRQVAEVVCIWQQAKQQQFDQVVHAFMQQCFDARERHLVFAMRDDLISKLPQQSQCELRQLSLGEWSLYFSCEQQSYEYYVGACGIFQLHVDRFGEEHKLSLWQPDVVSVYAAHPVSI